MNATTHHPTTLGFVVEPRRGRVVPFLEWRRIQRGRHKGQIEITRVNPQPRDKRFRVEESAIRRWPGKETA